MSFCGWVELHPLERPQLFRFEQTTPSGPVVATTSRGPRLGWLRRAGETRRPDSLEPARLADPADVKQAAERRLFAAEVRQRAQATIEELQLSMLLQDAECSLDGERLTLFFSAEERVDFRALVKALATTFRKKIELHQLAPRQRTQRQGALGRCGRECCCSVWLREFPAVSVRSAVEQGLDLRPEGITGVCGKLLCCLRYEYGAFLEGRQDPSPGDPVDTPEGPRTVVDVDPHTRTVQVRDPLGELSLIPLGRARYARNCSSCAR